MAVRCDQHEREVSERCGVDYDYMKSKGLNLKDIGPIPK